VTMLFRVPTTPSARARGGFTVVELLIVLAIVLLLLGLLLPALGGAFGVAKTAVATERMRQIASWMTLYSEENEDLVLPARFDHPDEIIEQREIRQRLASVTFAEGPAGQGTWADVLWVEQGLGTELLGAVDTIAAANRAYLHEAPDARFYRDIAVSIRFEDDDNPLRSNVANSRNAIVGVSNPDDAVATPWGEGAQEAGLPGYFAANGFFDVVSWAADPDRPQGSRSGHWSNAQIFRPSASMYLVDSFFGEVIQDEPEPFDATNGDQNDPIQVDFRYGRTCLMLFLDGHVEQETEWIDLVDLEESPQRGVRVRNLTER